MCLTNNTTKLYHRIIPPRQKENIHQENVRKNVEQLTQFLLNVNVIKSGDSTRANVVKSFLLFNFNFRA